MTKTHRKTENSSTTTADHERVAVRAFELYVARGYQEGQDLDDWLAAERELNSPSSDAALQASSDRYRDES